MERHWGTVTRHSRGSAPRDDLPASTFLTPAAPSGSGATRGVWSIKGEPPPGGDELAPGPQGSGTPPRSGRTSPGHEGGGRGPSGRKSVTGDPRQGTHERYQALRPGKTGAEPGEGSEGAPGRGGATRTRDRMLLRSGKVALSVSCSIGASAGPPAASARHDAEAQYSVTRGPDGVGRTGPGLKSGKAAPPVRAGVRSARRP